MKYFLLFIYKLKILNYEILLNYYIIKKLRIFKILKIIKYIIKY